ncbi:MAG: hypothetical protein ACR2QH_15295 [Geminicoccaceae bacterium]
MPDGDLRQVTASQEEQAEIKRILDHLGKPMTPEIKRTLDHLDQPMMDEDTNGTQDQEQALAAAMEKPSAEMIARAKALEEQRQKVATRPQELQFPPGTHPEIIKQIQDMLELNRTQARSMNAMEQQLQQERSARVTLEQRLHKQPAHGVGHPVVAEQAPDGMIHYKLPSNMSEEEKSRRELDDGGLLGT